MRAATIRVLLFFLTLQSAAMAVCGLPQPRLVCQEYFAESAVVVAKVVRSRHVQNLHHDGVDGTFYYMQVVRRLRGRVLNRFQTYEENSTGRTTFDWKRGEEYLLFISYSKDDRGWEVDGCGNSAAMTNAKKVLDDIARIAAGKERERIQGFIASEDSLPPHVVVKIDGGGKSRTVALESREFKLRVEPGTYVVTPVAAGWTFMKDDFSYDDPQRIAIQPGRCAQIQFQGKPVAKPQ